MRKTIYFILAMQVLFAACSNELQDNSSYDEFIDELKPVQCDPSDAIKYPTYFTKEEAEKFPSNFSNLSDETLHSMSTCGLLETLLDYPTNRALGPWSAISSYSSLPGVTYFNNSVRTNKVAVELFERSDCFQVLSSRYLKIIAGKNEEKEGYSSQEKYFEMLLASDMCMSVLTNKEKNQLMALALKQTKSVDIKLHNTYYIMISIMWSCNYTPFVRDVSSNLIEMTFGYSNLYKFDIVKYAKDFLDEQK